MHTQVIQRRTQLIDTHSPHACIFLFCDCNSKVHLLKINSEYCVLFNLYLSFVLLQYDLFVGKTHCSPLL